jgi:hypothetical protein
LLLETLGERSLKDNPRLWEAFQHLRTARNEYVHNGVAQIGDEIITPDRVWTLLDRAREILDWIEDQLPPEERRPRCEVQHEYEFVRLVSKGQPEGSEPQNERDNT